MPESPPGGPQPGLSLAMFNPAWFAFADANGGMPAVARDWGLGRCVLEACPPVVRDFYALSLAAALRLDWHWDHEYECSGPDVRRRMRMSAYPLRDGAAPVRPLPEGQAHVRAPALGLGAGTGGQPPVDGQSRPLRDLPRLLLSGA